MEELTEVITASEFHPKECNHFVYSSSKGTIRLCDMRQAALCDTHAKRKCCSIYSDTVGYNSSGKKNSSNEKIQFDGFFKSYFPVMQRGLNLFRKEKPFEDKYRSIQYSFNYQIFILPIFICCKTELSRNSSCPFSLVSCKTEVRISKELFSFLRECFIAMHFLWWPSNYVTKNLNILYIQMRI